MDANAREPGGLILHEGEHLLVVDKPAGINTHAASPHAGEGVYEWLRRREPRWADLAILQRLDKETSGVLVFSKTRLGNVALNKQFTRRQVTKEYLFLTDREPPEPAWTVKSFIRKGDGRFESSARSGDGLEAETRFTVVGREGGGWRVRAEPVTGRTHQIRLHAAGRGVPILGDTLYGGTPWVRLCLHARRLRLADPGTREPVEFVSEPDFEGAPGLALRRAFVDFGQTTAWRRVHGAADGHPGWYVDRLDRHLLVSVAGEVPAVMPEWVGEMAAEAGAAGVYVRRLDRQVRGADPARVAPRLVSGAGVSGEFVVRENGLRYRLSFEEGYSVGLFLDQRDNRRRLLRNWVGPGFPVRGEGMAGATVLNLFSYTCGFSVAAAAAGAVTTSLDLSRKYLDWGRRNLVENGVDPAGHDFIYGDVFDWLKRLGRKGRRFDVVLLDPPTFSQSKESGVFRAEADYAELVTLAVEVLAPGGVLLASTNAARLEPERWLTSVRDGVMAGARVLQGELFVPQPPDFPTCREEPGYLKTVWMRLG